VPDVRTTAYCTLQRSDCNNCNKNIIVIVIARQIECTSEQIPIRANSNHNEFPSRSELGDVRVTATSNHFSFGHDFALSGLSRWQVFRLNCTLYMSMSLLSYVT